MREKDTIVAISTPMGEGAIGVVRLSGERALPIGSRLFCPKSGPLSGFKPQRLYYGTIKGPDGVTIDDGYLVYMRSPHSFTGEDVVELQVHGSMVVLERIVSLAVDFGARLAEPGEFTKRAFLNGRIDLLQAEAVIDLIRAKTERALNSARGRLEGRLSAKVNSLKEEVVELVSWLEAELDFAEEEIEGLSNSALCERLTKVEDTLKGLISTYKEGRALREGISVVILGSPNVGKSTLLNLLLKEERAIVTPQPGTTRDLIEEVISIKGVPVRLVDTAGLRHTEDPIESIGIDRAKRRAERAELVIFVVDASHTESLEEDRKTLEILQKELGEKPFIVVANKIDLLADQQRVERLSQIEAAFGGLNVVALSAKTEEGLEGLEEAIYREVSTEAEPSELIVSIRHKEALEGCLEGIERAKGCIQGGEPKELVAVELRWALKRLGELTGETTTEDILDRIFSTFCIGK